MPIWTPILITFGIVLGVVLLLSLLIIYLYRQNNSLKITQYGIRSKKIPRQFDGFVIAQISDIHNTRSKPLKKALVARLRAKSPDVIVITGDLIDCRKTDIDTAIRFIRRCKAIAPTFFVPGNHEANISSYRKLLTKLWKNQIIVLGNSAQEIEKNGAIINFVGIKDPLMLEGHSNYGKVAAVLSALGYDRSYYTILLSHRPELLNIFASKQIDLVLAGHAHGGQIRLPFIGGLYAPSQGFFPKYTSGIHKEQKTVMIVNRGVGNSSFPFRINNRPELVFVRLSHVGESPRLTPKQSLKKYFRG